MSTAKQIKTDFDQAGEDLFNFAIEREDVKWLLGQLPTETSVKLATVEYELQILKIISVGWGISYFLEGAPRKKEMLGKLFWEAVNKFSKGLSETTGLMVGQQIDYFEILKTRLDCYVAAMADNASAGDPTAVIGPAFAELCGNREDIFAALTGAKMFNTTTNRVRQFLEALKLR